MIKRIHQTVSISRIDCLKGAWIPVPTAASGTPSPEPSDSGDVQLLIFAFTQSTPSQETMSTRHFHTPWFPESVKFQLCYNTERTEEALNHKTNRHHKRSHLQRKVLTENYNLSFCPQWPWLEQNPGKQLTEIYWLGDKWGYYSSSYMLITILLMFLAGWIGSV